MTRTPARAALAMAMVVALGSRAFALNPALDIHQYAHTSWKIRDGFVKGVIDAIAQTPDGYLWLGTEFGLVRFDGVRAVAWQPPGGDTLPNTWVRSLLVARDGTLWIGTLKGLASWKGGSLTHYPELNGTSVDRLLEDHDGTIWAGGADVPRGKLCEIVATTRVTRCYGADGTFGSYVSSLFDDTEGNLWVGAATGVWQWRPGPPKRFPGAEGLNYATSFIEDNGQLVVGTREGLKHVAAGRVEDHSIGSRGPDRPYRLLRDRDGGVWIGTPTAGLIHVHYGRIDRFTNADGLSDANVLALFEDREGSIWAATSAGLDRFRHLAVPTISLAQGLTTAAIGALAATADGRVLLGSPEGLDIWHEGRITRLSAIRPIWFLFVGDHGRLWIGTDKQFGFLDGDRLVPLTGVSGGVVRGVTIDRAGDMWIAFQEHGLVRLRGQTVVGATRWTDIGIEDFATAILADPQGKGLWLGFYKGGVAYFDGVEVRARYGAADGLGGPVADLSAGADGAIWIASQEGLSRLKNQHVATLTRRNGLPCDGASWMRDDDDHASWILTPCGLLRIGADELNAWALASETNPAGAVPVHPTVFDVSDGVMSHAFPPGRPPVAKTPDGRIWFLPSDGVSVIDPRHLALNPLPPPVRIEQVVANRATYDLLWTADGRLRLPPRIRDLEINYTALSLVAPEKMQFKYRLDGWDKDWQDVGTRRQAYYTNLPPRTYRFRVIASNNSGIWNDSGAALEFSIAPTYYQTGWFWALAGAMVVGLAWAAHRIRLRIVETHEREITALNERMMKAQEQERIRIAGELHDGVMQQMLSVTMMLGRAKRRITGDASDAVATIDKVQEKLVQMGTDIRQLSHGLHPPILREAGLPETVRAYCDEFSAARGIAVACDADANVRELSRGAALALFRIVQEALGNAAKHAHATRIAVGLKRSAGLVTLIVSDDGIGFDASRLAASGGLGLVMMRERAAQLNGTFEFETAPGRGTTITVRIPFR